MQINRCEGYLVISLSCRLNILKLILSFCVIIWDLVVRTKEKLSLRLHNLAEIHKQHSVGMDGSVIEHKRKAE